MGIDRATILTIYATINVFVFFCGVLVLMMQPGFMLLETGSLSRKNALNNIFKNFVDLCCCGVAFYFVGYAIIDGSSMVVDWMRAVGLARSTPPPDPDTIVQLTPSISIFYNFAFAAAAVTITSGAVTGRIAPFAYLVFGTVFSALVYPLVAFTVWNPNGLLYGQFGDFAGSAVVHALGGFAGLAGAMLLGPRIGEFGYGRDLIDSKAYEAARRDTYPHNIPLAALGVFLLWIGWYGFNAGSIFAAGYDLTAIAALPDVGAKDYAETIINSVIDGFGRVVLNTTLAPCAGVFVIFLFFVSIREPYHLTDLLNGALAGLVGVTASADILTPGQALMVGAICALLYLATTLLMGRWRIDDPIKAFAVHGAAGVLAVALRGVFDPDVAVITQFIYGMAIAGFAFVSAMVVFLLTNLVMRLAAMTQGSAIGDAFSDADPPDPFPTRAIRISSHRELRGLDREVHGEEAYGGGALFTDGGGREEEGQTPPRDS